MTFRFRLRSKVSLTVPVLSLRRQLDHNLEMDRNARQALFADLQPLARPTRDKPDPHENITDILEILAVADDQKPAHLQGQGMRDEERLRSIEAIAARHGLRTMRTPSLVPFFGRAPRFDARIFEAQKESHAQTQRTQPDVLWVYSDERLRASILETVAGRASVSGLLGYPECCVTAYAERNILMLEAYIAGISRTHNTDDPDRIIELFRGDAARTAGLCARIATQAHAGRRDGVAMMI